jgi:hypothetical protein
VRLVLPIFALAAFLLVVGTGALVVGVHDAALAKATLGVTLGGAVLLVLGASLVVAAADLIRLGRRSRWPHGERPPCRPLVLVAFLATILLGVYAFLSTIPTESTQRPFVAAAALVIAGIAVTGLRYFGRDARVTLPRVGTIVLGLVGTIVGAWQFWYQNEYAASRAGRAVALTADLKPLRPQKDDDVVKVTLGYEAIGSRSVVVIGSAYTLAGSRVVRCDRPATVKATRAIFAGFLPDPQTSRFVADTWEKRPATVLAAGKFVGDGKRLDPDVPAGRSLVLHVRRGRYQLLRLRAQLFAIPTSIQLSQRSEPEFPQPYRGDNDLYGFWHVEDDSWLHDLVYGRDRWVVLRYELVADPKATTPSPDLRVTARFPGASWRARKPSRQHVQRLFAQAQPSDASEPFADAELPLEPVAKPRRADRLPRTCGA